VHPVRRGNAASTRFQLRSGSSSIAPVLVTAQVPAPAPAPIAPVAAAPLLLPLPAESVPDPVRAPLAVPAPTQKTRRPARDDLIMIHVLAGLMNDNVATGYLVFPRRNSTPRRLFHRPLSP
jgi:hypothetical protein